ncbi:MAG TPA: hypothetical protein EYM90_05025 [Phycisphaerales bacterium]|nr:hypothetical protein [Phycisphaerales bacterium]
MHFSCYICLSVLRGSHLLGKNSFTTNFILCYQHALIWSIIRYRAKGDETKEPPQIYGSNPIEVAWTVIPIIIVFTLFLVTTRSIYSLDMKEAGLPQNPFNLH